jgi:hypothetical protein
VTSGSFNHTFDLGQTSTYNASYLGASGGTADGARDRLLGSMRGQTDGNFGVAYFNVHSVNFGPGEIRGNISLIPEPATVMLLALGAAAFAIHRRPRA